MRKILRLDKRKRVGEENIRETEESDYWFNANF